MENDMTGSAARSIRLFAQHGERASWVIVRDAPRPVGTEIGDEHLSVCKEATTWCGCELFWRTALGPEPFSCNTVRGGAWGSSSSRKYGSEPDRGVARTVHVNEIGEAKECPNVR